MQFLHHHFWPCRVKPSCSDSLFHHQFYRVGLSRAGDALRTRAKPLQRRLQAGCGDVSRLQLTRNRHSSSHSAHLCAGNLSGRGFCVFSSQCFPIFYLNLFSFLLSCLFFQTSAVLYCFSMFTFSCLRSRVYLLLLKT